MELIKDASASSSSVAIPYKKYRLANGLTVHSGKVTYEAVATELGYAYTPVSEVLG